MRDGFRHFYRPTDEEFAFLWKEATFVFDANVLLNLYRYSSATRSELLRVMRLLADRIWLPHQAALEFHRDRLNVIHQQLRAYEEIKDALSEAEKELDTKMASLYRDPGAADEQVMKVMHDAFKQLRSYVDDRQEQAIGITSSVEEDGIWRELTDLLEGRVGEALSEEEYESVLATAKSRYENEVPPGFADASKDEGRRYGDLLLWHQIIQRARSTSSPVILVTDDQKRDWWLVVGGQRVGPRPELVQEIGNLASVAFHIYTPGAFLRWSGEYLSEQISDEAIGEVQRFSLSQLPALIEYERLSQEASWTKDRLQEIGEDPTLAEVVDELKAQDLRDRVEEATSSLEGLEDRERLVSGTLGAASSSAERRSVLEALQKLDEERNLLRLRIDKLMDQLTYYQSQDWVQRRAERDYLTGRLEEIQNQMRQIEAEHPSGFLETTPQHVRNLRTRLGSRRRGPGIPREGGNPPPEKEGGSEQE